MVRKCIVCDETEGVMIKKIRRRVEEMEMSLPLYWCSVHGQSNVCWFLGYWLEQGNEYEEYV